MSQNNQFEFINESSPESSSEYSDEYSDDMGQKLDKRRKDNLSDVFTNLPPRRNRNRNRTGNRNRNRNRTGNKRDSVSDSYDSSSESDEEKYIDRTNIRKKTMPNESEEDSEDSDNVDASKLNRSIEKTNRATKQKIQKLTKNLNLKEKEKIKVPEIYIKPIYMHKLFIGNSVAAGRDALLNKLGIGTIISLSSKNPTSKNSDVFIYHYGEINFEDSNSMNKHSFILMLKIINKSLSNGNPVLVQCDTGLVSSIILVWFYLTTINNGLSVLQKYDWLKRKIPDIELERDPDSFYVIQKNIIRIYTSFMDDLRFKEHERKILEKV